MSKHHHDEVGTGATTKAGATRAGRNDGHTATARERRELLAKKAKTFLFDLPERLGSEVRSHPQRALLVIGAAGFGAGMVFGSRILRGALVSAMSVLFVDLGRKLVLDDLEHEISTTFARAAATREHN